MRSMIATTSSGVHALGQEGDSSAFVSWGQAARERVTQRGNNLKIIPRGHKDLSVGINDFT